jgi:predicted Rossmann fold flavoprotein
VLILEKNLSVGAKLSITGGGRCNILNAEPDVRALLAHYSDAAKFLHAPFARFGMQASWDFFEANGLLLKVEAAKRAFPASEKASDVVSLFVRLLKQLNVMVETGVTVTNVVTEDGRIVGIETTRGMYAGASYILATGGLSHPETGSTGDGLTWLAALGHTVHVPNPSLVPLLVRETWVGHLAGTALDGVKVTFGVGGSGKMAKPFSRTGKLLFTHFGLSGPMILNAAKDVQALLLYGAVPGAMDVCPLLDEGALDARVLAVCTEHKNKALKNVLKYLVPAGMSAAVASLLPVELGDKKVHSVTREERAALVKLIKALPFTITGTKSNDWAIVSDGGIDLKEVDTRMMCSKLLSNLFVTGDLLHISRPSGGYSLQLCWSTGYVAGTHA